MPHRVREDRRDSRDGCGPLKTSKLLVVEGNDDLNFFRALVDHLSIDDVGIRHSSGRDAMSSFLPGLLTTTGFENVRSLGIVRDADDRASSAFQSVQRFLGKANLPVPPKPARRWEAKNHRTNGRKAPAVSVFVLPDCESPGMLETLLHWTLSPEMNACISKFLECAHDVGGRPPKNKAKARVFAYLATQEQPRHSVGMAAKQGVWDFDHTAFQDLITFLRGL